MADWTKLLTAVDGLTIKERLLLTCALTLTLAFLVNRLVLMPLDADRQQLVKAVASKRQDIDVLQRQAQALMNAAAADPDAENRTHLAELREQLAGLQRQFAHTNEHLIAPERVPELLHSVLDKSRGLRLVRLEGLGAGPLIADDKHATSAEGTATAPGEVAAAYRHGVRIEIEGSYLDLLRYLREVEALPWTLYWDSAELRVTQHPKATLSVVVNTLSLTEAWIGT